jgi:CRISPR-associated protein Csd1
MILQRLAEHYDRMAAEGQVVPPGCSRQKISFCIVLNADGSLNQFESLLEQEGKAKRAKSMDVPGQTKPSGSGLNPCLLWDNASYLLGHNPKDKERGMRAFEVSRTAHLALEAVISHPSYSAVCTFLRNWSPEHSAEHPELEELARNFGVFRIAGERQYVHQQITLPSESNSQDTDVAKVTCLVSGENKIPARLHEPKIKGVADAQTGGALLVSFNADAFASYGKEQSYNAPVGQDTVFKYTNALNHLLASNRRISLGDATVTYWADHHTPVEDVLADLFSGGSSETEEQKPEEDRKRVEEARLLLSQLRSGTQYAVPESDGIPTKFFILGLSPNASRLSVRLWVEADANEMLRRLGEHVRDFALNGNELPPLWRIALATGRAEYDPKGRFKGYDRKSVAPKLAGDLARSVLTGAAYPQSLLAAMVRRISSDGHIGFERVCAIKGCLVRNTRYTTNPLEIPMKLDPANSDVAYRCGRLFAILEKAQKDSAGGDLNSTIKDRYFSAASVTPGLAFTRLLQLNVHHLNKLETGSKIYYEKLIASTMAAPFEFPRRLSLLDQGKFIVGYYQQYQNLYTKKEKAAPREESVDETANKKDKD